MKLLFIFSMIAFAGTIKTTGDATVKVDGQEIKTGTVKMPKLNASNLIVDSDKSFDWYRALNTCGSRATYFGRISLLYSEESRKKCEHQELVAYDQVEITLKDGKKVSRPLEDVLDKLTELLK